MSLLRGFGLVAWVGLTFALAACEKPDQVAVPGRDGAAKSAASVRAERRLFDGAPPVIPHGAFGAACSSCHNERGMDVAGVGFSPPSPHAETRGMATQVEGAFSRCQQCHVYRNPEVATPWRDNRFAGLRQDLRLGRRLYQGAPPVIPHRTFMRENCLACHSGPAAREEIRTTHPERPRCRQCHVEQVITTEFRP